MIIIKIFDVKESNNSAREQRLYISTKWNKVPRRIEKTARSLCIYILTRPTPLSWFEVSRPSLKAHSLPHFIIFVTSKRHSILRFYLRNFSFFLFSRSPPIGTENRDTGSAPILFSFSTSSPLFHFTLPVQFIPAPPHAHRLAFDFSTPRKVG